MNPAHLGLWLLAALPSIWTSAPLATTLQGTAVRVLDGDTLIVADSRQRKIKVRLSGIDAPEKNQPYGRQASAHLATLVLGKAVTLAWEKRDAYGRVIGQVLVAPAACSSCGKSVDVGLAQVTAGYAWWYRSESRELTHEDKLRFAFAENSARARHRGLWSAAQPVPPWQWRHSQAGHASSPVAWTGAQIRRVKAVVRRPVRSILPSGGFLLRYG
ncbi:MAG: thermonuclease family protein [Proteobacteria bacterium]|nr:thermonuclease family protein [Pseudomonadota bacterium]